jgi:hypothetical protein
VTHIAGGFFAPGRDAPSLDALPVGAIDLSPIPALPTSDRKPLAAGGNLGCNLIRAAQLLHRDKSDLPIMRMAALPQAL